MSAELARIEARKASWRETIVAPWYLRDSQLEVYSLILRERFPFIEAARRFGKTTSILAFVIEQLLTNPRWICRWCFPYKNQAREVLLEEVPKIQREAPASKKFTYVNTDSVFVAPNGSKLYLRGVNEDRGESARGPASNIIIADEYGFWRDASYIIKEVLLPQLENQQGRWLIKASTPPKDLGHIYYTERGAAESRGRLIQKTIYDNEALSPEELQEIIDECGGINSPSFQRERMCKPVADPKALVCREYGENKVKVDVVDDYPRPQFFDAYVGGDSGFDDNTAVLFGYYDFHKDELVFESEWLDSGRTSREIVDEAKKIEADLWSGLKPHLRVYDANKQLLYDVMAEHKYNVILPDKDDKVAALNRFRTAIRTGKIKIKPSCKQLKRQLEFGIWKNELHKDFHRSEELGHLDALIAAVYLFRSIDKSHNPWPPSMGMSVYTNFIPESNAGSRGPNEKALKSAFGLKT